MVRRHVRVYIEGGSEGRAADSDFRRGWRKFLNELHELARANGYHGLDVVRGKGRADAFRRFQHHREAHPGDLCVLLVDAETAVSEGIRVWDIVANREEDKWQRPSWATEDHLYLMVHTVETWLLADQDALRNFFKRDFDPSPLPTTNLEDRPKNEIEKALKKATKDSLKGPYRHGQAHEIIEIVQRERVKRLRHGQRLFNSLGRLITGEEAHE
jgi:hypothetical protein